MRAEIKTAMLMVAIVATVVVGIGVYFTSLDVPVQNTAMHKFDKLGLKKAPEMLGIAGYINADQTLEDHLRGKVVLYDIWTYSCINCQRTIPYLTAWHERYSDKGLVIVGIHSPEFEFEKDINNVRLAVEKFGIEYPVVLDNDKKIWDAFENRYWPRKYIADDEGYIRYDHIGEGAYDETEKVIQELLQERAEKIGLNIAVAQPLVEIREFEHSSRTPELYFGYNFAYGRNKLGNQEGFQPERDVRYSIPDKIHENYFYLEGTWKNLEDRMVLVSDTGKIVLPYHAKQVNIVAGGKSELDILINDIPIPAEISGSDVSDGKASISEFTLYNLVDSEIATSQVMEIRVNSPGFEIYTFTFG
ncbi:redoxin family protein [Candidatus Nitrosotenuis uzonensis]|uniref:Thiol-disulfide isomerase n=1 Tax=Candidatus Nitrosotenuis uzonensis TaxID=1407055 RepID=A0A812EXI8_9ARCH|nr:redoxin family protein [Candidatus Nitrosotenuis uzonensis]MCA2003853.1 redoxin domain-containing protein [Candidatus Nitrosotenuis sp.]CAE6499699.1 Thiol-disulfide isomerase [Candidatus Nitrosotenuis uzonensis]